MFGGGGRRASVEGGRRTRVLGEGGESVQGRGEKRKSIGGERRARVLGRGGRMMHKDIGSRDGTET